MAEHKKSFIAYSDWIDIFEELEDDEAGRLAKHLFRYVNDMNPTTDDRMVKISFTTIKNTLKRDLVKYEAIRERNRKNGEKGGRPKKPSGLIENPEKPQKADSVSVSDSVNEDYFKEGNWRKSFAFYQKQLSEDHKKLISNSQFVSTQERLNPNVDIKLSIEKSIINYWSTEAGWKNKKSKRTKDIDWKSTLTNAINMNKVYKQNERHQQPTGGENQPEFDNSRFKTHEQNN